MCVVDVRAHVLDVALALGGGRGNGRWHDIGVWTGAMQARRGRREGLAMCGGRCRVRANEDRLL